MSLQDYEIDTSSLKQEPKYLRDLCKGTLIEIFEKNRHMNKRQDNTKFSFFISILLLYLFYNIYFNLCMLYIMETLKLKPLVSSIALQQGNHVNVISVKEKNFITCDS